ncbi:MAG: 6-phosphofructokinase [Chloroflexi bacterium]|nr:6-phosphofructokinase [Chloroflexota bacterium]MBP6805068.1 6-phosphofructokinase [Chloroflexota bacterium]MBP7593323.1 6-phosphofructokinase [Chloroflexota bacterium]
MKRIGVFTSGGDAQGMNAAVRAVVRTALDRGAEAYAIYEGYQGMVDGGRNIRPLSWNEVGGILQQGGTIIGSARCLEFRERPGRLRAVANLLANGIDKLVCIGGDGSLTGAFKLYQEWPSLIDELLQTGVISPETAVAHPQLAIAGIIGSIDNDMYGSDMTTGADTALHRIVEAVDAITSTAASHQRSFVIEVMGRRCGYLALMSALATGADWVLIPEAPPNLDNWEAKMCEVLSKGRENGRRDSIVIVAEGAQDRHGSPITSQYVKEVLEERLGEDARITVLGHVQRGGAPSAFDRNLATQLGVRAVEELLADEPGTEPFVMGIQGNKITRTPLAKCLEVTQAVADAVAAGQYEKAMELRGRSFMKSFRTLRTLVRALPHPPVEGKRRLRIAVFNAGGPAPGMNTAVRAAVRLGTDKGHIMLGVNRGFRGLIRGEIRELNWMDVSGLAPRGGSELGTNRTAPEGGEWYAIARNLEEHQVEGILVIGGWTGYKAIYEMQRLRENYPAFKIPMICLPATINNNLLGSELSVGADTALNSIVDAVDKIKQSAVASRRTFVVEVMGHYCGYLALMSALATGAERVYIHEEGVTLKDLVEDVSQLIEGFQRGKRVGLMIRNEHANDIYSTDFMRALFEEEGSDLFDVRQAILGHMQQGGNPTPYDRILATRMASDCVDYLEEQILDGRAESAYIGLVGGDFRLTNVEDLPRLMDTEHVRPKTQWWMDLRPIARTLAQPAPRHQAEENK